MLILFVLGAFLIGIVPNAGEVFLQSSSGVLGFVCAEGWTKENTLVVCRMTGYPTYV